MKEASPEQLDEAGPSLRPTLGALLALVFPGAGHFVLGRRALAAAFGLIVLGAAAIGLLLQGKLYASGPGQPLAFLATLAEMGMGIPYFVLRFFGGYQGDVSGVGYEYGKAFLLTAGLMNLLLVLDAWDIARGAKR